MKKTYVDVDVHNRPRVSLPGLLPGSLSTSSRLIETFLSELCLNSADTIQLIQVGETVSMGEFEVSLFDEDVVKIITLDQQSEFFLNFRGVRELCRRQEELLKLAVSERVELEVIQYGGLYDGDENSNLDTSQFVNYNGIEKRGTERKGTRSKKVFPEIKSPFTGHAYLNIMGDEDIVTGIQSLNLNSGFGQVMSDLDNYNSLGSRESQFNSVNLPHHIPPAKTTALNVPSVSRSVSPQRILSPSTSPIIEDYRPRQVSGSPLRFGRMDMTLREDQGDKPGTAGVSHNGAAVPGEPAAGDDFLAQRGSPLPYCKTNNVIGTLNEYLQKQGETPAEIIVTSHSQTSFSAKVYFSLHGKKHEHQSDTRYRNKKDAKQNAAYMALVALDRIPQGDDKKPVLPVKSTQSSPAAKTANSQQTPNKNYKNLLQEFCQKNSHPAPKYQAKDVGDQHSHVFEATVTVKLNDGRVITGTSDRLDQKKLAEFQAAEKAYKSISGGRKLGDGKSENGSEVQTNPGNAEIVTTNINWKNKLQELFQKSGLPAPKYRQHPALDGFKSSVILELEKDGSKSRKFTSDLRKNLKAADMHAAELAYRAIAENSTEIVEIGRGWDFRNWHDSRSYPAPCYETRVVKRHPKMSFMSTVRFNCGGDTIDGDEQGSKKAAENSATQAAIRVLKKKGLWDIADL